MSPQKQTKKVFKSIRDVLSAFFHGYRLQFSDSVKCVEDVMMNYDLVDIWRIRNPNSKKFSWRQKSPIIQRRLDYWLISDLLQDDVAKVDIVTAIKTDHHAITLEIDSVDDQKRGPSFWMFNNSVG